jgi:hypothetical protein
MAAMPPGRSSSRAMNSTAESRPRPGGVVMSKLKAKSITAPTGRPSRSARWDSIRERGIFRISCSASAVHRTVFS